MASSMVPWTLPGVMPDSVSRISPEHIWMFQQTNNTKRNFFAFNSWMARLDPPKIPSLLSPLLYSMAELKEWHLITYIHLRYYFRYYMIEVSGKGRVRLLLRYKITLQQERRLAEFLLWLENVLRLIVQRRNCRVLVSLLAYLDFFTYQDLDWMGRKRSEAEKLLSVKYEKIWS